MANEFVHGSVGTELTQAEWEGVGTHVFNSQATGDIVYASSSSQLSRLAKGTDTHVLILSSGIPAWSTSTGITSVGTIATGTWEGTDVGVAYGGTGVSTLTDGGVLLGSGTGAITAMAVLTDGQMIVGNGSTDPVAESGATLRTSIGVGTGDSPQFTGLTLTGDLAVNGDDITSDGSLTIDPASALILELTDTLTASALSVAVSSQNYYSISTRRTVNGGAVHTFDAADRSGTASQSLTTKMIDVKAFTMTYAGGTQVTNTVGGFNLNLDAMTYVGGSALTLDVVSGIRFNLPVASTNITATDVAGIRIVEPSTGAGTITTQTGIKFAQALDAGSTNIGIDMGTNSIENVGASGNDWTQNALSLSNDYDNNTNTLTVSNTSTASSANQAVVRIGIADASTGDPYMNFNIASDADWALGVDHGNSDRFAISRTHYLDGTNDAVRWALSDGEMSLTVAHSTSYFDYVCDSCGRAQIEMFECCGTVAWHDDVLALKEMALNRDGLEHMAKLGVMSITHDGDDGAEWIGINVQTAQHFTWSAMHQMYERINELETKLEALGV